MNRRALLLGAATSGMALALLGCGGDSGGGTVTPAPSPTPTPTPTPAPTPTPTPVETSTWACIGDSMTHGVVGSTESIPFFLTEITARRFDDLGVIGQTSAEIAARVGATPTILSVTGDTIPASGRVSLTALAPKIVNHTGPDIVLDGRAVQLSLYGQLAGVAGYLGREADDYRVNDEIPITDFHFTRLADGAATPCPPSSRFVPDNDATYRTAPLVLRMGYNNRADFDQVTADHLAVFAWNTAARGHILLLDPPISYYDDAAATARSDRIAAWLQDQAAARGMRYFSVHGYVASAQGLADAGVTPTADDLAAIADRRTPMSATVGDGLHYSAAMNRAVAAKLAAVLRGFGAI